MKKLLILSLAALTTGLMAQAETITVENTSSQTAYCQAGEGSAAIEAGQTADLGVEATSGMAVQCGTQPNVTLASKPSIQGPAFQFSGTQLSQSLAPLEVHYSHLKCAMKGQDGHWYKQYDVQNCDGDASNHRCKKVSGLENVGQYWCKPGKAPCKPDTKGRCRGK